MPGRTIAIGDIHGCAHALETLLKGINPKKEDLIITLGDYVDRGPSAKEVVEILLELRKRCRTVHLRGNHEILLLASLQSPANLDLWMQCGGGATIQSYGGIDKIPPEHIEFFRGLELYYETDTHMFVHANYRAELELKDQDESHLFWEHLGFVLPNPHESGKTVVMGHTPQRDGEILDCGYLVCIDTFCFGGGWLTAYEIDSGAIWQAKQDGSLRR